MKRNPAPKRAFEFYLGLPKVELHRHLEGSLRLDTLVEVARLHGYDNYADPLNGEANRFNRTSGLIESNQFLTWRCNTPGFWRIHIAYDASDTYTVRMWRALDPLISKAVGEVVEEFDNVYCPDLRRLVDDVTQL